MGKHETIEVTKEPAEAKPGASDAACATLVPGEGSGAHEAMKSALAAIEELKLDTPKIESPTIEIPRIELSGMATPKADAPSDEPKPSPGSMGGAEPMMDRVIPEDRPYRRMSPFAVMAASLGGAAAFGAMIGALIATGIVRPTPVAAVGGPKIGMEEINTLKEQVVQARVELAALKTNIDAGHRSANQQFTKIGERVERMERVQAEPVARLTKAVESLNRWEQGREASAAKEVTGSIASGPAAAALPPRPPGSVEGWVVREVRRGTAYIEGRMGIIEVDPGDIVPGLGRVESIRKQDGRWVVVTSRGIIPSASR